jgi:hypothetical protein
VAKKDISFASDDISSSKKISPLPVLTSPLQRRYLLCQCCHLLFREDISFASDDISSSKKISPFKIS